MDGLGAADAFYQAIKGTKHTATYWDMSYSRLAKLADDLATNPKRMALVTEADVIFFVDICPQIETLQHLIEVLGKKVVILDHHETGAIMFRNTKYTHRDLRVLICTDQSYSGATLTWALSTSIAADEFFNWQPEAYNIFETVDISPAFITNFRRLTAINSIDNVPLLYGLIGIRDTWKVDHPQKEDADGLNAFFRLYNVQDNKPGSLIPLIYELGGIEKCILVGKVADQTLKSQAKQALDNAARINFTNEVGDKLLLIIGSCPDGLGTVFGSLGYNSVDYPCIVVGVFNNYDGPSVGLSLRSKGYKCRLVAEALGGGGHDAAAGVDFKGADLTMGEVKSKVVRAIALTGYHVTP